MSCYLIENATVVNEMSRYRASVLIRNGIIEKVFRKNEPYKIPACAIVIDASDRLLIPGVIDSHVHFREPGLTHKGDMTSESRAAIAGGITSFMDMPNTIPQTTTQELLKEKFAMAGKKSMANYSFYIGITNDNLDEIMRTNPKRVAGIKLFMGSSTGNMLVDNYQILVSLFSESPMLIAAHCEDEHIIQENTIRFKEKYGDLIPPHCHAEIRSAEACYKSSSLAVELAKKYNSRLHILHLSTQQEVSLFENTMERQKKRITSEVCIHHLFFNNNDYKNYGNLIKCNPAIKTEADRHALFDALIKGYIDTVATDHAPHTIEEKSKTYLQAPSGGPMVQHSLAAMLELCHQGKLTTEKVVEVMCHAPADIFSVEKRGYIREGFYADLVLIDPEKQWTVSNENILYKCHWSLFEGKTFHSSITHTFINGHLAYENGRFNDIPCGMQLCFNR
jgi:dihydroorotase